MCHKVNICPDFGYDISSYVDVDPIFGTLEDFDTMSAAARVGRGQQIVYSAIC